MTTASPQSKVLLIIAYVGFISLGLPDTLVGVAWPSARDEFKVPQAAVALIFIGTGSSYFLSSFFTGKLMSALGIGLLLATSSTLVAASAFAYAAAPIWSAFVACSILHGLGSGAIDAGLNHFAAHNFSARHMNWLHACYSVGATLGPVIMTALLTRGHSWRTGYLTVAVALACLSVVFGITRRRWDLKSMTSVREVPQTNGSVWSVFRVPLVWLQITLFFVYTGLEITVGQWTFTLLTEARHLPDTKAGALVAGYWASIVAGRILFGFVVEQVGIDRLLRLSTVAAVLGVALLKWSPSYPLTAVGLILTGLGLAPIYPCMMTRTPERLGLTLSTQAIGLQVSAAMLGAALLPSIAGLAAQHHGLEVVPLAALGMAVALVCLHEILVRHPSDVSLRLVETR